MSRTGAHEREAIPLSPFDACTPAFSSSVATGFGPYPRAWLAASLVGLTSACAGSQPRAASSDPAGALQQAVAFLQAVHPATARSEMAAALAHQAEEEAAALSERGEPTDLEVARALQRTLAVLGDAHLYTGLPSPEPSRLRLPLLPVRLEGRWWIDASKPALPRGTELLAVERMSIEELMARLSRFATVDGGHMEVRRDQAERRFATFAYLLLGPRPRYTVRVRRPGGVEENLVLPAVGTEALRALEPARHSAPSRGAPPAADIPWPFLIPVDGQTVLLRLPSFGVPHEAEYQARVDALFASLGGRETLILDLRGNEGGLRTHGIAVLRHLLQEPFTQWARVRARVQAIPET